MKLLSAFSFWGNQMMRKVSMKSILLTAQETMVELKYYHRAIFKELMDRGHDQGLLISQKEPNVVCLLTEGHTSPPTRYFRPKLEPESLVVSVFSENRGTC